MTFRFKFTINLLHFSITLYNIYLFRSMQSTPFQTKTHSNDMKLESLHVTNPRAFKTLSRLNQLPKYDYQKVFTDFLSSTEIEYSMNLGYGLKYAIGLKLFKLPNIDISESQNSVAKIVIQKIISSSDDASTEKKNQFQDLSTQNFSQLNLSSTFDSKSLEITLQKRENISKTLNEQDDTVVVKIKCMQQVIKQQKLADEDENFQENNNNKAHYKGNFWFYNSYFTRFQEYLLKSEDTIISEDDLNGDILKCLLHKQMKQKFSSASQTFFDDLVLKIISIKVIQNQVFSFSCLISKQLFHGLIQAIINLSENYRVFQRTLKDSMLIFYVPQKRSLKYYLENNIYKKCEAYKIAKQLIDERQSWYSNYLGNMNMLPVTVDGIPMGSSQGVNFQLLFERNSIIIAKVLEEQRAKCAKIVSKLLLISEKTYKNEITSDIIGKFENLQSPIKRQLVNLYVAVSKPIKDPQTFNTQYECSLKVSTDPNVKKQIIKAKNYIKVILNNKELTQEYFTHQFMEKMLESLIGRSQKEKQVNKANLQEYFEILIKYHEDKCQLLLKILTAQYFQKISQEETLILEVWIAKIASIHKKNSIWAQFLNKFVQINQKKNKEYHRMSFWLIIIERVTSNFQKNNQEADNKFYLQNWIQFWRRCIISSEELQAQHYELQIYNGKRAQKTRVTHSLVASQIFKDNKKFVCNQILFFYLDKYFQLDAEVRVNVLQIFELFIDDFRSFKKQCKKILEKIFDLAQNQQEFGRNVRLRQIFYIIYDKIEDPKTKENLYVKTIELCGFYEPKSGSNREKILNLNSKILQMIPDQKTDHQKLQLQKLQRILFQQSLSKLHERAFYKLTQKLKGDLSPTNQLVCLMQKYILEVMKKQEIDTVFAKIASVFVLSTQLSKPFIRSCFTFFYGEKPEIRNKFTRMVIEISNQQLEDSLFNLVQQKQIIYRYSKESKNHFNQMQVISSGITLLDEEYLQFIFKQVDELFESSKQDIIWKVLEAIGQLKDSKLYNLAEKFINTITSKDIRNNNQFCRFLSVKCKIMGELSEQTIQNSILALQQKKSLELCLLVAEIILKYPKTCYKFSVLYQNFKQFLPENGSERFTKALTVFIKTNQINFDETTKYDWFLDYPKRVFDIGNSQHIAFSLDLLELVWNKIQKIEFYIEKLLLTIKKHSKDSQITEKYKEFIKLKKIQHKINLVLKDKSSWQKIKFHLLNEQEKKKFVDQRITNGFKNQSAELQYISNFVQHHKLTSGQLRCLIKNFEAVQIPEKDQDFSKLIENIIKHQINYNTQQNLVVQLINSALIKSKIIIENEGLTNLLERIATKSWIDFPGNRHGLPQFEALSSLHHQKNISKIMNKIQKFNSLCENFWFFFTKNQEFLDKVFNQLLQNAYKFREQLGFKKIRKFVEKILLMPMLRKSNKNLILLTQHLIENGCRNSYILSHYHLYLLLCEITQNSKQKLQTIYFCLGQNPHQSPKQSLLLMSQISQIKQNQESRESLSEKQQLIIKKLKLLIEDNDLTISNLAWRCIFSICHRSDKALSIYALEITLLKTRINNPKLQQKFNNLLILSSCEALPACNTVTQVLLKNMFEKFKNYLQITQIGFESSREKDFDQLRNKCEFLIERENTGIPQLLIQNEYFIKNLENLFERKFLVPEDMMLVLELAKLNFEQITEQLTYLGKDMIQLLIQRRLKNKNIYVIKLVKFCDYFSLRNCFTIIDQIKNERNLQKLQTIITFLEDKIDFSSIYDAYFTNEPFQDLQSSIFAKALTASIPAQIQTKKLYALLKKLISKAIKSSDFYEGLFQKIQKLLKRNLMKPQFLDNFQTYLNYIAESQEITTTNIQLLNLNPDLINKKFIQANGMSHQKNIDNIIAELKIEACLTGQQIQGLQQFLQKAQHIKEYQEQMESLCLKNSIDSSQQMVNSYNQYREKLNFPKTNFFAQENYILLNEIIFYQRQVKYCKSIQKNLRNTQKIAIWIALNSLLKKEPSNIVVQVCTGQGKSLIIVGIATILARKKLNVDIITSSPVLAQRDKEEFERLYRLMGVSCDSNIQKVTYDKGEKQCYKNQVVYGTCTQFSFDWLRHHYCRLNTKGNRSEEANSYLIIDEADNCMLDDLSYVARLADSFPGAQCLLPFYYHVWNMFQEQIKRLIQIQDKLYLVKGLINLQQDGRMTIIYSKDKDSAPSTINNLKQQILKCISQGKKVQQLPFIQDVIQVEDWQKYIQFQMKSKMDEMLKPQFQFNFIWSDYARKYAKNHTKLWSQSLIIAERMSENIDYIITKSKTIKLVDYLKTGVIQNNTSLSNAVHQFLQCKHQCPLTLETRTTNYLSYYSLFQKYQKRIVGLTGTIGGQRSRQMFKDFYNVECKVVPKFMKDMMFKLPSLAFSESREWINAVIQNAILQTKKGRAVLIVCLTIQIGSRLAEEIKKTKYNIDLITTYFSNDSKGEGGDDEPKTCKKGQIIIATNLAGRGMDIKTQQAVESCGGLHVILTYVPSSQRVEMQIMGRTSRNGKLGSFQRIICCQQPELEIIDENLEQKEKYNREIECEKLESQDQKSKLKKIIEQIIVKDELFSCYNSWLIKTRAKINSGPKQNLFEYDKTLQQVLISEIEDRFSQLIQEVEKMISQNKSAQEIRKIQNYELQKIINDYEEYQKISNNGETQSKFIRNGCYLLKLANAFIQSWKFFQRTEFFKAILDKAKQVDPLNFNVYYLQAYFNLQNKCCCFTQNKHKNDYKQQASELLKKSKKLLLDQMTGYESVIQHLMIQNQQTGKMYKQFEKKIEICTECLQSIDRMLDKIQISFCPIELKIFKDGDICQFHPSLRRKTAKQLISKTKGRISIKSLRIQTESLCSLLQQKGYDSYLYAEGQLDTLLKTVKEIKQSESKFRFQKGQIHLSNISPSDLRKCTNLLQAKKQQINCQLKLSLQFSEKSVKDLSKIQKENNLKVFYIETALDKQSEKKESEELKQKFFCLNTKQYGCLSQILDELKDNSKVRLTYYLNQLKDVESILEFYSSKKTPAQGSIEIKDSDFKQNDRAEKYTQFFKKNQLQIQSIIYCQNNQKGLVSIKLLDMKLQKDEKNVDIEKTKRLAQFYPQTNAPVTELAQMYNRGFQLIFEISNRKPFPLKAVFILGGIAAVEIILGSALMITGVGFTIGAAILTQSLNEIFAIIDVCRTNQFQVKSYLIGKAISLTITAITLGASAIKNAGQGIAQVGVVLGKQVAEQGVVAGAQSIGKSLISKQTKKMMCLIGKHLMIEAGEQLSTKAVSWCLNQISDWLVQRFQIKMQQEIHNLFSSEDKTIKQLKKLRLLESYQKIQGNVAQRNNPLNLKSQIEKAFYPDSHCPYISQILDGLKTIAAELLKTSKTFGNAFTISREALNIVSLIQFLYNQITKPLDLMKQLLNRRVFNILYPESAVEIYLSKKQLKVEQIQKILQFVRKENQRKQKESQQIIERKKNQNFVEKVGNEIIDKDNIKKLKNIVVGAQKVKNKITQQQQEVLNKFLNQDTQYSDLQDFQLVEKVMVDFVMSEIKKNVRAKIMSTYVCPFVNKFVKRFVNKQLNKVLANKNQHHQEDKQRYQRFLKEDKSNLTEGDKDFMEQYQNPDVKKQLQVYCRYKSSSLTSRYTDIKINQNSKKKLNEKQKEQVSKKVHQLKENRDPILNQADMKMIALKMGLKIKIVKDPNYILSQRQIKEGVQLILYEQGNFNDKGEVNVGHFKVYDQSSKSFKDLPQESNNSCGMDVMKHIANNNGHNIKNNKEVKELLINQIQQNPYMYKKCQEAAAFLSSQYPKYANSLTKAGGFNRKLAEQKRDQFYGQGDIHGHGYNSQIYNLNQKEQFQNYKKVYEKLQTLLKDKEINEKNQKLLDKVIKQLTAKKLFVVPDNWLKDVVKGNKTNKKMTGGQKLKFINKQLNNISKINQFEKKYKFAKKTPFFTLNDQQYQDYQIMCRNTYNTCCRHFSAALMYLYAKDPNFVGVLQDGDKITRVGAKRHTFWLITDNNKLHKYPGICYVQDPTDPLFQKKQTFLIFFNQLVPGQDTINNKIQELYQLKNEGSQQQFIQKVKKLTKLSGKSIKQTISTHNNDRMKQISQLAHKFYRVGDQICEQTSQTNTVRVVETCQLKDQRLKVISQNIYLEDTVRNIGTKSQTH